MHSTSTSSADRRKLIDLIRDVKIAMLTTRTISAGLNTAWGNVLLARSKGR